MNTRLQVEHPVTEAITGQDLVEWQLRVAAGEKLPCRQDELSINGWAMEARLYAENSATGFLPSVGRLDRSRFPTGVRVDSGVEEGNEVTPHYDPMIAKLIVHPPTRAAAAAALAGAASGVEVWPVKTNAAFLARAASDADFVAVRVDTGFIERHADRLLPSDEPSARVLQLAAQTLLADEFDTSDPWRALHGFRANGAVDRRVAVEVGGGRHVVEVENRQIANSAAEVGGERVLFVDGEAWKFAAPKAGHPDGGGMVSDGAVVSSMPGQIVAVEVSEGQAVTRGQKLLALKAMKMEQILLAPFDGVVANLKAAVGQQVAEGVELLRVVKDEP